MKTFLIFTNQCFLQRLFNKKRRLTFFVNCERSKKNDEIDETINNRVEIVVDFLLFLFRNEKSFQFEQHNNYDDFDFDIEIERFVFEFSNIVFITEKTKISKNQFSKIDKNRISTSRFRVVKKSLSFFWYYFRKRKNQRTYKTKKRIYLKM